MATYRVPVLAKFNWQQNVKDKDLGTPAGGESKGDRYIVSANGGAWSDGAAKDIAWWDGSSWNFDTPTEGWQCWIEDENLYYYFDGSNWVSVDASANTSNISSHTIQIASLESKQVIDRASIDSVETVASDAAAAATTNSGNVSSHTIQIASLEGETSSHTIQIASLENETSSHTIQIASNESNISSHTIELASAQNEGTYVSEYGAIEFTI